MLRNSLRIIRIVFYFSLISFFFTLSACQNEVGTAQLKVALIDAPADYQEVNIDIQEIQFNSDADTGFVSVALEPLGVINLLELTGGFEAILTDTEIPAGRLNQIRLILGNENTLKVNNKIVDLTIPSGSTSGLKVKVGINVVEGEAYKIVLDFDVSKSIVKAGKSGKYNLKPVIRTIVENDSHGRIIGKVNPITMSSVSAIIESDTLNTFTNIEGEFDIRGAAIGTYMVLIQPDSASGFSDVIVSDVFVMAGEKTDLGVVELN